MRGQQRPQRGNQRPLPWGQHGRIALLGTLAIAAGCWTSLARAGAASKAASEAAEFVLRKSGKEAAEQGVQGLAKRVEQLVVRHGDDAVVAARRAGPAGIRAIEQAGAQGETVVKLLARHGDDALWITARPGRLALFARYGDDAAEALVRHQEIAVALIEQFGAPAARAVKSLDGRNARRLAMLAADGPLFRAGRADELLEVIGRYGDRGMDFVWRNKGPLAVSAVLAAFLANPQPFVDGTCELAQVAGQTVAQPLATASGEAAKEAARRVHWTAVVLAVLACAALWGLRHSLGFTLPRVFGGLASRRRGT